VRFFLYLFQIHLFRINFGANLDAENAGNDISGIQISKIFWGVHPQTDPPPIQAWYIGHTRDLQSLMLSPLIYYLTERSFLKKCPPPTGKSLKKALRPIPVAKNMIDR
jgi:hypothetical protein